MRPKTRYYKLYVYYGRRGVGGRLVGGYFLTPCVTTHRYDSVRSLVRTIARNGLTYCVPPGSWCEVHIGRICKRPHLAGPGSWFKYRGNFTP